MAGEQKPGRQPLLREGRLRTGRRGLKGHDKSKNGAFGPVGCELGGGGLEWSAVGVKYGVKTACPKTLRVPTVPAVLQ
jgi:hypothetical protein